MGIAVGTASAIDSKSSFSSDSPNLDCLRSYAVLLVLIDHVCLTINPHQRGVTGLGFFGVLIFFVHTSLVLMLSMERASKKESRLFLPFYIRRFFRIYPLAVVCVLLAVFSGYKVLTTSELWSNLALVMNFTESRFAIDPMWSLPYEVQMYILLPFLYLFVRRFRSPWATAALFAPLAALAVMQPRLAPRWDIVQYAGCFLPGIMAYQLSSRTIGRWKWWLWPIVLVLMTVAQVALGAAHPQPLFVARWPGCLAIGLAAPRFAQMPQGVVRRVAHIIAKYSYGIYLTHIFSLHIAAATMAGFPLYVRLTACIAMMTGFPYLAYTLVEAPGIKLGKRLALLAL